MRALVRSAEDPTVAGLMRDALGLATQAQHEVGSMLQAADRETTVMGDVVGHATSVANAAFEIVRKVPGASGIDRILRAPLEGVTVAAQQGEMQAKVLRTNLEA